jgi:hypothetical protein
MGFKIFPKSFGGYNLTGANGPLARLLAPKQQINNLLYPSDLGSNLALGHAVIIQAFDYTTGLTKSIENISLDQIEQSAKDTGDFIKNKLDETANKFQSEIAGQNYSAAVDAGYNAITNISTGGQEVFNGIQKAAGPVGAALESSITAVDYIPQKKGSPLATISLYMPENLTASYNSQYSQVSITEELGLASYVGNAYADYKNKGALKGITTPYVAEALSKIVGNALPFIGGTGQNIGNLAKQGAGIFTNPQIQLLYQGTAPREFTLDFLMTPKTPDEAKNIQDICDTLTFYSLPGVGETQNGKPGQFLTPPQIFTVQFKFLGQKSISGVVSNVITSALKNSGLGFLTQLDNPTSTAGAIGNAPNAKVMTVNDCFLSDVSVDYAPNGFAAYNDGYPVQTRLSLSFKETTMITKQQFKGGEVSNNYSFEQQARSSGFGSADELNSFNEDFNKSIGL